MTDKSPSRACLVRYFYVSLLEDALILHFFVFTVAIGQMSSFEKLYSKLTSSIVKEIISSYPNLIILSMLHLCVFKDRVVDDLNPVLNFTRKEVDSLLHFVEEEPGQITMAVQGDLEEVIYQACKLYPHLITKVQSQFAHNPLQNRNKIAVFGSLTFLNIV